MVAETYSENKKRSIIHNNDNTSCGLCVYQLQDICYSADSS